ncbi:MAG: hypothetical protein AAF439_12605 [Pseudomonadota bacterium]
MSGASRRNVLAGLAALAATPAFARFPTTTPPGLVFFVGNSFTRQHDIPALVCRIAEQRGFAAKCHRHTANGAWLIDSIDFANSLAAERGERLPASVVLQDHSIAPLSAEGRAKSARAMAAYAAQFDRTVLFETWPRRDGHPLYRRSGMPSGPADMTEMVHAHYRAQAEILDAAHAPVGLAWQEAGRRGIDLHARDGYHANLRGAWTAALLLAQALGVPEPFSAAAPDVLPRDEADLVAEIAASVA